MLNGRDLRVIWRFPDGLWWRGGFKKARVTVRRSDLRFVWNQDEVTVPLRDMTIRVYPDNGFSRLVIQADVFDGRVKAEIGTQGSGLARLTMKGVQLTPEALSLGPEVEGIFGRLDGRIRLQRLDPLIAEGQGALRDGRLVHFPFLEWMADYFVLSEIRTLRFNTISAHFRLAENSFLLSNIFLESSEMGFKGELQLDRDRFLSSRFTVSLRKRLMERSPKLRVLVKRLPRTMDPVPFDFRLTGRPEALNFQWLASDTRESFMEKVPHFILRRIERYVEEMR